jgi:hypothetical protein
MKEESMFGCIDTCRSACCIAGCIDNCRSATTVGLGKAGLTVPGAGINSGFGTGTLADVPLLLADEMAGDQDGIDGIWFLPTIPWSPGYTPMDPPPCI